MDLCLKTMPYTKFQNFKELVGNLQVPQSKTKAYIVIRIPQTSCLFVCLFVCTYRDEFFVDCGYLPHRATTAALVEAIDWPMQHCTGTSGGISGFLQVNQLCTGACLILQDWPNHCSALASLFCTYSDRSGHLLLTVPS